MRPPGAETPPLNVAVKAEVTTEDPAVETAGFTVNPKAVNGEELGFPVSVGSFPGGNTAKYQGNQTADFYAEAPLPTGQRAFSLTGSAFVPQTAGVLQTGSLAPNHSLFSADHGQSVAAVLAATANEPTALPGLRADRQGVSVSGETENALKPLLQTVMPTVSEPGQVRGNQGTAPVVLSAAAFASTPMPGQPKGASQTEALQSVKMGFVAETVAQNRDAVPLKSQNTVGDGVLAQPQNTAGSGVSTQPQNTVGSEVLTQPQNRELGEIREQNQGADDVGLQNTPRAETLSQTQAKTTDQTQSAVRNQLAYQISAHFDKGSKEFKMQLYPKDLGKVNVKMRLENSTLILEISAVSAKTQSIILANADDIKAMLQSHMRQDVQISLTQDEKFMQQQLFKDEQGGQHNPYSAEDQQAEENEEQHELDTEHFLKTLNMFSEKYFTERKREYAD